MIDILIDIIREKGRFPPASVLGVCVELGCT